jgi:hypothetical protein
MTAVSARPKRKRRVASDEAHAWARNLTLHNPFAKSVLRAIALYTNDEGSCIAGLSTLAEDCDLSEDTVRKRLKFLEEVGAVVRLPNWLDDSGRRNSEGRGKRTTDDIRLLLEADADDIEARARGEIPSDDGAESDEISPRQQQGLNADAEVGVSPLPAPPLAVGQPSDSGKGLTSEPEPESPPEPPSGGTVDIEGWKEFQEDWSEPILRQSMAQQVWQALTADERTQARQAARGYVAWRKTQRKPPNVLGAHLFLKERDAWARFAAYAPDVRSASGGGFDSDSVEGRAILAIYAVAKTRPFESRNRLIHAGEITPQVLAFANAGSPSSWPLIEDRQQIAAWSNFLSDHVRGNRPQFVVTRGIGEAQRRGIEAPWPWPPSAEGKIYATGPPDALMSEQDLQEEFK